MREHLLTVGPYGLSGKLPFFPLMHYQRNAPLNLPFLNDNHHYHREVKKSLF